MVIRVSDKTQNYSKVTKLLVKPILNYLYECLKKGIHVDLAEFIRDCNLENVSEQYWQSVIEELDQHGYIKGVIIKSTKTQKIVLLKDNFGITLEGVEYLQENSMMSKVKDFLGSSYEIALEATINYLLSTHLK